MRRRIARFLLGSLYVVLLAALLITHTRQIAGELERTMALVETLLLAVPAFTALVLYVRMENAEEGENPGEKGNDPPAASGIAESERQEKITSMEQLREKVAGATVPPAEGCSVLTQREWEIAWLLYRGYSNRQIAEEYCIAETTVKKHVSHIYEKLQVSGRKEFKEKYR